MHIIRTRISVIAFTSNIASKEILREKSNSRPPIMFYIEAIAGLGGLA